MSFACSENERNSGYGSIRTAALCSMGSRPRSTASGPAFVSTTSQESRDRPDIPSSA